MVDSVLSRGWEIVRALDVDLATVPSITARRLLAEYVKMMNLPAPIGDDEAVHELHTAILSAATWMGIEYPDFHFVPFLELWGLENLRPEDGNVKIGDDGKHYLSLVERMAKAYAYNLLFHPDEHLSPDLENIIVSYLLDAGYVLAKKEGDEYYSVNSHYLATRLYTYDYKGYKMTRVCLLGPDGREHIIDPAILTQFQKISYSDIPGKFFTILMSTYGNKIHNVRAALLAKDPSAVLSQFPTTVGYVDHVDHKHGHVHIFDRESRHLVATIQGGHLVTPLGTVNIPPVGTYVQFIPVIPEDSKFKTATVTRILSTDEGPAAFGYRKARITYVNIEKAFASWELLPGEAPVVEAGIQTPSFTTGYLNLPLLAEAAQKAGITNQSLLKGRELSIITFLKRGKDKQKRPCVIKVELKSNVF